MKYETLFLQLVVASGSIYVQVPIPLSTIIHKERPLASLLRQRDLSRVYTTHPINKL